MSTLILSSPERFQASHRRSYTLTEKLNVLEAISNNEDNNVSSVARQHDVSRTLVYKWQDQKDSLLLANEQRTNPRRVYFVDERRSKSLSVTPRMIYHEWLRVDETIQSLSEHCVRQRIYRFMRRNSLVLRRTTHQAQRAKNNPRIISDWIEYIGETIDIYGITNNCVDKI